MAKRYSPRLKFQSVIEVIAGEKSVAQAAKAHGVHLNSIDTWKRQLMDRGAEVFERRQQANADRQRIAQLERLLGQKEVEIALLKNFLELSA